MRELNAGREHCVVFLRAIPQNPCSWQYRRPGALFVCRPVVLGVTSSCIKIAQPIHMHSFHCGQQLPLPPALHVLIVSLLQHTWFKWTGCYQVQQRPDDEILISIRCAGGGAGLANTALMWQLLYSYTIVMNCHCLRVWSIICILNCTSAMAEVFHCDAN